MRNEEHEQVFARLRAGEIGIAEFARATAPLWRRQASILMRRWRQPAWVGREDVEQDMLEAALKFVWEWEPDRGTTLVGYVLWNAFDKAKKRAHRARKAKLSGDADKNPSRYERPLSAYAREGSDEDAQWWEARLALDAEQEVRIDEQRREEAAVRACKSALEKRVVRELRDGGDLESVVARLEKDRRVRRALGLKTTAEVIEAAVGAASAVAARMTTAA